ncbi:hypothetical protein [Streptomyces buecherae]|uniref:Uncharacterized protein n=1 Tax=Streptomyces buecherae TaxID=2763006 RepID=A0A7H8N5E2_9ACTN|nr:hypothetical protein [Streptomyces buecherae]QKW49563.1 hypothetical protein HUT08_08330 [Streptomyces buecherae]
MTVRERTAPNQQRGDTAWGARLLLFTALLFDIVTMHTLGHPTEHGGTAGHARPSGATPGHPPMADAPPADPPPAAHAPAAHAAHHPTLTSDDILASGGAVGLGDPRQLGAPGHGGMDPLSVCLAVLAAWSVVLLLSAAARRRASACVARLGTAYAPAPWPAPPPRPAPPTRTTVLRL